MNKKAIRVCINYIYICLLKACLEKHLEKYLSLCLLFINLRFMIFIIKTFFIPFSFFFSILMDETYTNQSWRNGEVVLNDLQILNLQRIHNEVILSCRAVNTILSTPATASVKIKMHCEYFSDVDWILDRQYCLVQGAPYQKCLILDTLILILNTYCVLPTW